MRKFNKTVKFILLLTLLMPLVYTPWTIYPSHFGKTAFFQIIIAVLVAASVLAVFRTRRFVRLRTLDWLILSFAVASLLSSVLGVEFNRSFWGDQSRAQGVFTLIHFTVFYFLIRHYFQTPKDWQWLVKTALIVSLFSSLIAWFGNAVSWLDPYVPNGRLQGLIGNPIFFANYLLIPAFLGLASFFYFSNSRWRWLWLVIGLFNIATIIGSETRGPLSGLILGAAAAVVLYFIYVAKSRARILVGSLGTIVLAVIILGFASPAVRGYFPARLQYLFSIKPSDATAQTRLMAWKIAYEGWKEKPLFGWGPESYQYIFDHKYNPRFLRFSFAETVWDQPHNYALEILSSRGIVGLSIYLGIIVWSLLCLWRLVRLSNERNKKIGYIILMAIVIAYVGQLSFSFETSNSWQLWFVLLAYIVWLRYGHVEAEAETRKTLLGFMFAVLSILAFLSVRYNYQILKSSYYTSFARDAALIQSVYLWQQYATLAIKEPTPFQWEQAFFLSKDMAILDGYSKLDREAVAALGPSLEKVFLAYSQNRPDIYLYQFWLGQVYAFMGEFVDASYYAKAETTLRAAWEINKFRQAVPLLLAKTLFIEDKIPESTTILREVVAQDPTLEQPHWFLGLNLVRAGQLSEGITELEKGETYGLGFKENINYLIGVYNDAKQYEKITPLYEQLIALEPGNYRYYAGLAATQAVLGRKQEAIGNINKAVELNPSLREEAEKFIRDNKLY